MYSFALSLFYTGRADIALSLLVVELLATFGTIDQICDVVTPRVSVVVAH
jgi:hypothetical protein